MNRKVGTWGAACWIAMALTCLSVRAQDAARVPGADPHTSGAVDASVHADVDEGTKPAQSTRPPSKRPQTHSSWGFPSTSRSPATRFGLAQPKTTGHEGSLDGLDPSIFGGPYNRTDDSETTRAVKDASAKKLNRASNPFDSSLTGRPFDRSPGQFLDSQLQPLPTQPLSSTFSTPFRAKPFGGVSNSTVPDAFPKPTYSSANEQGKAKKPKSLPEKSSKGLYDAGITRSLSNQKRKMDAKLTVRPE
jgi:hypothetical protein